MVNLIVMVEVFVKDYFGVDKVFGIEIVVSFWIKRVIGFVKKFGVFVGDLKRLVILKEFGDELLDFGFGDWIFDYDFMFICKVFVL